MYCFINSIRFQIFFQRDSVIYLFSLIFFSIKMSQLPISIFFQVNWFKNLFFLLQPSLQLYIWLIGQEKIHLLLYEFTRLQHIGMVIWPLLYINKNGVNPTSEDRCTLNLLMLDLFLQYSFLQYFCYLHNKNLNVTK